MAKQKFSRINTKAAAITGAIVGFLCWLLIIPYGFSAYGMMGYVMGFGNMMMGYDIFHSYTALSILLDVVLGALFGAVLAYVYNWALGIK